MYFFKNYSTHFLFFLDLCFFLNLLEGINRVMPHTLSISYSKQIFPKYLINKCTLRI